MRRMPLKQSPTMSAHPHAVIVRREADNPMWSRSHSGMAGNPRKIIVSENIRESAIGALAARGHLDQAQVMAASRFRKLVEMVGGSGQRGIDYSRERVDGSREYDGLAIRGVEAAKSLARCEALLGKICHRMLLQIVVQGYEMKNLGETQRERNTAADYIRDGLDTLAEFWGYKTPSKRSA